MHMVNLMEIKLKKKSIEIKIDKTSPTFNIYDENNSLIENTIIQIENNSNNTLINKGMNLFMMK